MTALWATVYWCFLALLASRTLFVVLSSPAVLDFSGGCAVPCLLSLALGWVRFWPVVSTAPVRCEVCSLGCPSWLVLPFLSLFLLHRLLRWGGLVTGLWPLLFLLHRLFWWGGLVTGLWPLLLLLCVGLLCGLCCAVLSPWPLVAPSPSVVSRLGFFLCRLFGLGLVGCGPAWVPAFFWGNSPSLVLVFSLGGSYCLVVIAP